MKTALRQPGVTTVILDLTLTTFSAAPAVSARSRTPAGWPAPTALTCGSSFPRRAAGRFLRLDGFDRVLAIHPTLRAALTVPRASPEGTRTALWPRCPVEGAFGHPYRDRLAAGLAPGSRPRTRSHHRTAMTVPSSCTATAQPKASR
jgi:hypothetical protein